MAFALFIPGSLLGVLAALVLSLAFQTAFWIAAAAYFAFAFGVPTAVLFASYLRCANRKSAVVKGTTEAHSI